MKLSRTFTIACATLFCLAVITGCSTPKTTVKAAPVDTTAVSLLDSTPPVPKLPPAINYTVSIPDIAQEKFQVTAMIQGFTADTFQFPIWAPGAYDIVNFGKYVQDMNAKDGKGMPLTVKRIDTSRFVITGAATASKVELKYTVRDIEKVPNSMWMGLSDIESNYAFANATALFGYVAGHKDVPCTVTYNVPSGWNIAVGLDPLSSSAAENSFSYRAKDYDELVDAPVQMGKFQKWSITVNGKEHIITMVSPKPLTGEQAAKLLAKTDTIVKIYTSFFGEMPYDRYVFQHYLADPMGGGNFGFGFGALEHRNSSTYVMPYPGSGGIELRGTDGKNIPDTQRPDLIAQELADVIAHEYFHLWSPKRIHVAELGPFDYQRAPRTKSLWFAEGITEYYAHLLMVRNGLASREGYFGQIYGLMTEFLGKPQRQSITDLSYHIADLETIAEIIPLYTKGPLIGLLLDAEIRSQTGNAKSLDDAMRYFNDNYGKTGKTFGDDDIIPIMERATGAQLGDFYRRYIAGKEALPFETQLPKIGLGIITIVEIRKGLGAEYEQVDDGLKITKISKQGTAANLKLHEGDILVTLSGGSLRSEIPLQYVPLSEMDRLFGALDETVFTILRKGKQMQIKGKIVDSMERVRKLDADPNATPQAAAIRKSMFGF